MIDVVNCSHHYKVRLVLRDINLHVSTGELLALMGPNGSGKSTLMAIIAGAIAPARGYVQINGQRRRASKEIETAIRRSTVYLPPNPWIPGGLTGREWLLAVGRLYGHEYEPLMDHADRLFALFDLTDLADSTISSYSTGQCKKIALSAALITQASVLLLDEPFAGGLDPSGILALKRVLQHLHETHKVTIIMATPVPELVEDLADRIGVISEGKLVALDTMQGLRRLANPEGQPSDAKLDVLYEKLVSPHKTAHIDQYLQASP